MVHLVTPNDTASTYAMNKSFFPALKALGRVGLTVHNKSQYGSKANSILYQQITWMHMAMPEAVWYIENEHNDLDCCVRLVEDLRKIGIESYLLIDTCHLQMDLAKYEKVLETPDEIMINTIRLYAKYIGAFHLSCSRLYEGYSQELHGKPIITSEDEEYFSWLVSEILATDFQDTVFLIPEVTETSYTAEAGRENGKYAYDIICGMIEDKRKNK